MARRVLGVHSDFTTGGGTANLVPKGDGAGSLIDSSITDNGTTVSTTENIVAGPNGLAATPGDGLTTTNNTASTVGVPVQVSGNIRLTSEVWNTTAVAANNWADWRIYNLPVSGLTPTSSLQFDSSLSTTSTPSYTNRLILTDAGQLRGVVGSGTVPTYSFAASTNTGMWETSNSLVFAANGGNALLQGNTVTRLGSAGNFGWSSNSDPTLSVTDTQMVRAGPANIQLGAVAAAAPVSQTLSVQNATATNSDQAAGTTTLALSTGTGIGAPGQLVITGANRVATGTGAQTAVNRVSFNKVIALTSGAAATVVSIPLATLQMAGGTITYHLEATDGTNQATRDGVMTFCAVNSAGVFVTQATNSAGALDATACTSGKTLTLTWAVTSANPALVQMTPTLTGITPSANKFIMVCNVQVFGQTNAT